MDESGFDASSVPPSQKHPNRITGDESSDSRSPRPFLGIRFQCCRTYGRIYRNAEKWAYEGQCPKCFARVSVPIGTGGTTSRFFNAG